MPSPYVPSSIVKNEQTLARIASGVLRADDNLNRYTIWAGRPGDPLEDCEEIDVDAVSPRYARECAALELEQGYDPGLEIKRLEERYGLYL